jgi:hypothetical protein
VTSRHPWQAEDRLVDADDRLYPHCTTTCRFIEAAA